jgi:2-oxoglutarate dehydrogenase E1 component
VPEVSHHISPTAAETALASGAPSGEILDHLKVQLLVRAYQVRGHHLASLDPLGILQPDLDEFHPPELEYSHYGFTEKDLDRVFHIGPGVLPGFQSADKKKMTLREIIASLKATYCAFDP